MSCRLFFHMISLIFVACALTLVSGSTAGRQPVPSVRPWLSAMLLPPTSSRQETEDPNPVETREDVQAWDSYTNVCETFVVIEGDHLVRNRRGERVYPVRYRRHRYERKLSHQRRTRELIRLVAREMGADIEAQYLLDMMAHHESSWNPEAIHILNQDLAANTRAWERHSYSRVREDQLLKTLAQTSKKSAEFWDLKAELADLQLYRNNPYWGAQLAFTRQIPERTIGGETYPSQEWRELQSVWSFGYGLYGMNAVLFTHVISHDAPPWVLCSDEGIVATVDAIWALREQQSTCEYLSQKDSSKYGDDGGSIRSVIHRWGTGQCGPGRPGKAWRRLFPSYVEPVARRGGNFTWESVPHFGTKFPQFEMERHHGKWRFKKDAQGHRIRTDPEKVFKHMRDKASDAGLLREKPLERKTPGTASVIVASR